MESGWPSSGERSLAFRGGPGCTWWSIGATLAVEPQQVIPAETEPAAWPGAVEIWRRAVTRIERGGGDGGLTQTNQSPAIPGPFMVCRGDGAECSCPYPSSARRRSSSEQPVLESRKRREPLFAASLIMNPVSADRMSSGTDAIQPLPESLIDRRFAEQGERLVSQRFRIAAPLVGS